MVRLWQSSHMNLWERSRQIMASRTLCALYLHDAQFRTNRLNFIQSKKEEDSGALVQRCFFIWQKAGFWGNDCRTELHPMRQKPRHSRSSLSGRSLLRHTGSKGRPRSTSRSKPRAFVLPVDGFGREASPGCKTRLGIQGRLSHGCSA
jgi:hypothetical protein